MRQQSHGKPLKRETSLLDLWEHTHRRSRAAILVCLLYAAQWYLACLRIYIVIVKAQNAHMAATAFARFSLHFSKNYAHSSLSSVVGVPPECAFSSTPSWYLHCDQIFRVAYTDISYEIFGKILNFYFHYVADRNMASFGWEYYQLIPRTKVIFEFSWILECVRRYEIVLNLGAGHGQLLISQYKSLEISSCADNTIQLNLETTLIV